ncbi:hypothetical protein WMY93_026248 [Mugilogobius chulae]|uniref:Uncharacterized protein n=1 Tax=Mugilogobius chulae TaxID=88201 RepID=A0AAW0N3N8_9GOBI
MSLKGRMLKALVKERLTAAAEEIFALFERTIADFEEELCRSNEENRRKQELLDSVMSPKVLLMKAGEVPTASPEPGPNQGLDQDQDQDQETPQASQTSWIKEEPEEHIVKQEQEQPQQTQHQQQPQQIHVQNTVVKVEHEGVKRFVKLPETDGIFCFAAFLREVTHKFGLPEQTKAELIVTDETGTEVDADFFDELMKCGVEQLTVRSRCPITDLDISLVNAPLETLEAAAAVCDDSTSPRSPMSPNSLLENISLSFLSNESSSSLTQPAAKRRKTIPSTDMDRSEAQQAVHSALKAHSKGMSIFREYAKTKTLSDRTRRLMVNILVTAMIDSYGQPPPSVRIAFAKGIVALFPCLEDPFSRNGYEHFYDPVGSTGYLAWRLKTVQRKSRSAKRSAKARPLQLLCSPTTRRIPPVTEDQLHGEECVEVLSQLTHTDDRSTIREKMRLTFQYRQNLVHSEETLTVFQVFPRFLDTPGLIEQDFSLIFGEDIPERFISKWPTYFKPKVFSECQKIPRVHTCELLSSLDSGPQSDYGWDSDVTSLLLLLHLLPPTPQGQKKMAKISSAQAADHLFKFVQKGSSVSTFLQTVDQRHPFLLCVGERKRQIETFFVVIDRTAVPCAAESTLAAFDTLFKAHYVFSVPYDDALAGFYTFIQTTVYNIDVGLTKETPRVKELRTRLLQEH